MMFFKKNFSKTLMKTLGYVSLFLASIVIVPTSAAATYQPKCPDELLR